MSGKRQHFIPRFLQQGFVSRRTKGESFTWVYRKNAAPFETNIINSGVESFFYSTADEDADPDITDAENEFSSLLDDLRDGKSTALQDSQRIGALFAHLEARTRHVRQSFVHTSTQLVDSLLDLLDDPSQLEHSFDQEVASDPSILERTFGKEFKKQGLPESVIRELLRNRGALLNKALPGLLSQMSSLSACLREKLPSRLTDASKLGHIRALKDNVAPRKKTKFFAFLDYRLEHPRRPSLVLGDSALLFRVEEERPFRPFLDPRQDLRAALLPLTPDTVLVGSSHQQHIDVESLPTEIARCSLEYFIASERSRKIENLQRLIGENAHWLSRSELDRITNPLESGVE